ncbi:semialdehyde dehydrogenase, NAD-binding domain protein [Leptospira interrogans serovar Bataviae str. HAI135]|nr:semialdehyde dehydrogenase, NAD-binding domain protein [Leptospira interrogans serovar Bataviae str. HAI135]
MKILIIGASGYLGGRIAQLLAKEFPSASLRLASSKIQKNLITVMLNLVR